MNWKEIKTDYITSDLSYRQLAQKYSVSFSTLSKYAAKHNWPTYRKKHRDKVVSDAAEKIGAKEVNRLAKVAQASDRLARYIAKVTRQTAMLEREEGKPDTRAIRDLTASLRDLTAVIRDVYDIPTLKEQRAYDLAIQRLEMDLARSGVGENEEDQTGVIVLAEVLPAELPPSGPDSMPDGAFGPGDISDRADEPAQGEQNHE